MPIAVLLLLALMAEPKAQPPSPAGPPNGPNTDQPLYLKDGRVAERPNWIRLPSGPDLTRAYPQPAMELYVGGRVRLGCIVQADGLLTDCKVQMEDPAGAGFGKAGLKLAGRFKMKPMMVDGEPMGGAKVIVPMVFKAPPMEPMGGERLTYDEALYCVWWHSARLALLPHDAISKEGLPVAESLAFEQGRYSGWRIELIQDAVDDAKGGKPNNATDGDRCLAMS